jgi:hypothetical protein
VVPKLLQQKVGEEPMKAIRGILPYLGVLALLAFATTPARAGADNCANPASCGFGAQVGPSVTYYYNAAGTLLPGPTGAVYKMTESVYSVGSAYSYVFNLSNATNQTLTGETAFTGAPGFGVDEFNPNYNFGVVTDQTSGIVTFGSGGCTGDGFCFGANALDVSFTLGQNSSFTFYAEGGVPTGGTWRGQDGVTLNADILAPLSTPEPGVLTLLGSLLLVLVFGMPVASRLRVGIV